MNWYIRTVKETNYVLSEPYETLEEAEIKLQHLHKKKRESAVIIKIPNIRDGLILYKKDNDKYYKTLIGESIDGSLWFAQVNTNSQTEIPDPIRKSQLINWYVQKLLSPIEKYNNNISFHDVKSIGECDIGDNDNLKEE